MKGWRLFASFIFFVALVTAGLSFMMATHQKIVRSIEINAPASAIYDQLKKLENFNRFSIWTREDSSAVYTMTGTDGTVGATSSWKGSPLISGDGKIEIKALTPNQKVTHQLQLTHPKKINAESVFSLQETAPNKTNVTWTFLLSTPRPKNIFNLFYSMDKEMGKDFEDGLKALKLLIEETLNAIDTTTQNYQYHFAILDNAEKANPADSIYTCSLCTQSIAFMEINTGINAHSDGSVLGKLEFSKSDLKNWHDWYNKRPTSTK